MALDSDRLGDAFVVTALSFLPEDPAAADKSLLEDLMRALAADVIKEFKDNAVLTSSGATELHSPGLAATITALPGVISA